MYANDTEVYAITSVDDIADTQRRIEQAVNKISIWMAMNYLKLNPAKTEFLVIRTKHQANRFFFIV